VNLENVGSTAVLLPRDDDPTRQKPIVVNVEVHTARNIFNLRGREGGS
jgi:hypothetical protein